MSARFQAAVAGGGTVGLACALLLNRRCDWEVALVERSAPRNMDGEGPQRALTLSPGAVEVLTECGAGSEGVPPSVPGAEGVPPSRRAGRPLSQAFPAHAFSRMVVWRGEGGPASGNSITFDAAELGVKALGCVAHEAPLRRALWDVAGECKGIRVYSGAALTSVRIEDDYGYLDLDNGEEIGAELLIGADGAQSQLRSALGVEFRSTGYGQTGLVFEADCSEADGDTAWQRFEDDGVLALLPLSESRMSIVWSLPDERAERIKDLDDQDLQTALNETGAGVAGNLTPATPIASFPLAPRPGGANLRGTLCPCGGGGAHHTSPRRPGAQPGTGRRRSTGARLRRPRRRTNRRRPRSGPFRARAGPLRRGNVTGAFTRSTQPSAAPWRRSPRVEWRQSIASRL